MSVGKLQLEAITAGLTPCRVGRRIEIHDTLDSTNRLARERLLNGGEDGLVILAEYQSAGRGRFGRRWESPRGAGVMMSLVLLEPAGRLRGNTLALVTAVAAVDAVASATGVSSEIKWPNDLMVKGRKLGGILVESKSEHLAEPHQATAPPESSSHARRQPTAFVVGIGINCLQHRCHFPPELRASATSLDIESDQPVHRTDVVRHLLVELDRRLTDPQRWNTEVLKNEWLRRALPLGSRVRLRQVGEDFSGQVVDVDPAAGLVVQLDDGGRRWFDASSTSSVEYA